MRLKRVDHINVIPFIDIMLVLLVIVLTTASFVQTKAVDVNLPKSDASDTKTEQEALVISLDTKGAFLIDNEKASIEEIEQAIKKRGSSYPVELHADQKSLYSDFVQVLQMLKRIQHKNLFIVTDK